MKSYFVYLTAALMMAACSGGNLSDVDSQTSDSVDKSDSDLLAFSGLVGIDRDKGKFSHS